MFIIATPEQIVFTHYSMQIVEKPNVLQLILIKFFFNEKHVMVYFES